MRIIYPVKDGEKMGQNRNFSSMEKNIKKCVWMFAILKVTTLQAQTIHSPVPQTTDTFIPTNFTPPTVSDENPKPSFFEGEWYFSWGYNKDYWSPSDIHVTQGSLNNDFTIHNVEANDYPQWDDELYDQSLTTPQYNFRIGHFMDEKRTFALEFSFDHTKFSSVIDQTSRVTGTIGGQSVDMNQRLTSNYFRYNLHNGANHIMINAVKRIPLLGKTNETLSLSFLGKAGGGIMLPHSDNTILGRDNNVGSKEWGNYIGINNGWWQVNGWTIGIEAGLRFVLFKPIYVEFTDKEAYANLINVPVHQGIASQQVWMNELILSLGFTLGS